MGASGAFILYIGQPVAKCKFYSQVSPINNT